MTSTYYNWFRRLLILGAVVATGVFASTAGAMPQDAATTNSATTEVVRPPDVQDSAAALYSTQAGLKADGLRLQGMAQVYRDLEGNPRRLRALRGRASVRPGALGDLRPERLTPAGCQ